ncbi:GDP-L-fucose synthase [Aeromicrobium sp.]|uniref:GDP-L-fucose synthase n=1 Tax=Aeromicrobium sp. TaxID=1871063 RepID=UPI00198B8104|nr:GDP-L-fucose synthase [Aeromicrobium sp.]MBC7632268.1 GDP-L-fucose synthase [Aeromicrobium sp.]
MTAARRIYVAGHRGMVGSAIVRHLEQRTDVDLVVATHEELDLVDQRTVAEFVSSQRLDEVYLAAARVGGIQANNSFPADFIYDNLMIEANIIKASHDADIQKLIFLGSSCIYPRNAPQPMPEEALLTGVLEPTNEPYAIAKIAGIKLCESYNRQHGRDYRSVMPTNLYGPGDSFHPDNSHVLPALLRRFDEAARSGAGEVTIWGSGAPRREFLHVDDMAAASVHIMDLDASTYAVSTRPMLSHINVGTGEDCTVAELATQIADITGFAGRISHDATKPDGTFRKLMDVSRLTELGWTFTIPLADGLRTTYDWFLKNEGSFRGR